MDTRPATTAIKPFIFSSPAYLYIGASESLIQYTLDRLQQHFCKNNGCSVCIICRKVQEQQHACLLWLCPEKQYSVDDLKVIFSALAYQLEPEQHFFFVLQKAETLTTACANALLKSLEEPPTGYHFILLASRAESILPTVKSRCFVEYLPGTTKEQALASLFPFFTTTAFQDPAIFLRELDATNPNQWQSIDLIDQLFIFWSTAYKKNIVANDIKKINHALAVLDCLNNALKQPPMPGSSKIFFKNLFLQIKDL
jgi:hypothetical protein